MTDLSQMSDADLLAALKSSPDVGQMVQAEATRQGVDPALALSVARAESGLDQSRRSPKGAMGVMQLMPGTASDLGVDPTDLADNIKGGVSYLKQQIGTFKDPHLAVAAYNAGPGAVQQAGGVPNFPETRAYVQKVMGDTGAAGMSDADLMAALGMKPTAASPATGPASAPKAAPVVVMNPESGKPYNDAQQRAYAQLMQAGKLDPRAKPGSEAFPRGLAAPNDSPDPGSWYVDLAGNLKQAPGVDYVQQAANGFTGPWVNLGHDVMQSVRNSDALLKAGAPKNVGDFAHRMLDFGGIPTVVGDALSVIPSSIMGTATRPAAAMVVDHGPTIYSTPKLQFANGRISMTDAAPLHGENAIDSVQNTLNTALSAARPAVPRAPTPAPMSVGDLRAAKNAAYANVDSSNFAFPQADVQQLADDMAAHIRQLGGPEGAKLLPSADIMQKRLDALAKQPGGVPLGQLDKLRSDLYDVLVKPGGPDSIIGNAARRNIDSLVDASGAPDIANARDLNTRLMKTEAINDRLDSAGLRAGSTYSGGNYTNAVRQSLRPLVDPTSGSQIRNLTPDEVTALRQVINGTPVQNVSRYASKLLTNKLVQVPAGVLTGGKAPVLMEGAGFLMNKGSQAQTNAAVQRLLDLISSGGNAPAGSPPFPTLSLAGRPAIPMLSGRGAVGVASVLQHARQTPDARH